MAITATLQTELNIRIKHLYTVKNDRKKSLFCTNQDALFGETSLILGLSGFNPSIR